MPSPIAVFCYNRPDHLKRTIEGLKLCRLADQSPLIIFSDGSKSAKDTKAVQEIRDYLPTVEGFASVTLHFSEQNKGLAHAIIEGVSQILETSNTIIVLEDDMLTATDFLEYMNDALHTYEHRHDIFSVSGYSPPIPFPSSYDNDVYLAARTSSWGWATWKDRWQKAVWQFDYFDSLRKNGALKQQITRGGEDLWPMFIKQQLGVIDSWSIRWTFTQALHNGFSVYPVYPKIKNIGTDGSGTNFTSSTRYYDVELNEKKIRLDPDLSSNPGIEKCFKDYYRLSLFRKLVNWWRYRT
jgi:glycosyltransferase involved in cell wall biosynthesis